MTEEKEINQLPKDWKWVKLGEAVQILDNLRKPINSLERQKRIVGKSKNELFPYYGATCQVGWIDNFITDDEYILVGEDGAPFLDHFKEKAYKINGKTWVNNHAHILKEIQNVTISDFILHYLNSINYRPFVNGTTRLKLTKGSLIEIPFPLPPKPTQLAIVSKIEELFSEIENGINSLLTAKEQLKKYRQSVLKWAFEGKLSESGFTRLKDEQDSVNKKILQSSNPENPDSGKGELPKGWKWVKLGDVCNNVEYGSASKSKKEGKVPVLRMGNMQHGIFDWSDLAYTDDEAEIKKYLLKKNDVLFNRTNSADWVGKTSIYKGERPAIFAGYLIRINRIENLIDAGFLTYYLNSQEAKKYGNQVRSFGVNQSNINGTKLKSYPIPLPSIEEQKKIVEVIESRLSVADKMEESITQNLQQSEALKQSILKKAFEGRLI